MLLCKFCCGTVSGVFINFLLWNKDIFVLFEGAKGHCNTERPGAISCIVISFIMYVSMHLQKKTRQTKTG